MMSEAERLSLLVYLCIGGVVGLMLSILFVVVSGNPVFWLFVPLSILIVGSQGFVRNKKGLE